MHIAVLAKQVLDPDGVNSYALWGRLAVDASGRSFTVGDVVPQIINAYDEQAMEAAMRLRDAGVDCRITAISCGTDAAAEVLKRLVATGADASILVRDPSVQAANGFRTAALIAAVIRKLGDVDLVLCGRQGSDYDQGTVPGVLAELLDAALVTIAGEVRAGNGTVEVGRMTAAGQEVVEATLPAVVSVSNEIGQARYPTSRGMMEARRKKPTIYEAADLLPQAAGGVEVTRISVPALQGHCEIISGDSPAAKVAVLLGKLAASGVFGG